MHKARHVFVATLLALVLAVPAASAATPTDLSRESLSQRAGALAEQMATAARLRTSAPLAVPESLTTTDLPSSPSTVTVDPATSPHRYRVWLDAGDVFGVSTHFVPDQSDIPPLSAMVLSSESTAQPGPLAYGDLSGLAGLDLESPFPSLDDVSYLTTLVYKVRESGYYNLDVLPLSFDNLAFMAQQSDVSGSYVMTWTKSARVTVDARPRSIPYGGSAVFRGQIDGDSGFDSALQLVSLVGRRADGQWEPSFASVGGLFEGSYRMRVRPRNRATYGVAIGIGLLPMLHAGSFEDAVILPGSVFGNATISPRVYIGRPRPVGEATDEFEAGRTYYWRGALKPRHRAGGHNVILKTFRRTNGRWVHYKDFATRNSNVTGSTSAYSRGIEFPSAGRWKIETFAPGDAQHAPTNGPIRTLVVH